MVSSVDNTMICSMYFDDFDVLPSEEFNPNICRKQKKLRKPIQQKDMVRIKYFTYRQYFSHRTKQQTNIKINKLLNADYFIKSMKNRTEDNYETNQFITFDKIWLRSTKKNKQRRIPRRKPVKRRRIIICKNIEYQDDFWQNENVDETDDILTDIKENIIEQDNTDYNYKEGTNICECYYTHSTDKDKDQSHSPQKKIYPFKNKKSIPKQNEGYKICQIDDYRSYNSTSSSITVGQRSDFHNKLRLIPNPENYVQQYKL